MNENEHTQPKPSVEDPEAFLNKPEVSRRLQIPLRTLDHWMKRGVLPYYKLGRSVRFKWSEVERHLAQTCRVRRLRCVVA